MKARISARVEMSWQCFLPPNCQPQPDSSVLLLLQLSAANVPLWPPLSLPWDHPHVSQALAGWPPCACKMRVDIDEEWSPRHAGSTARQISDSGDCAVAGGPTGRGGAGWRHHMPFPTHSHVLEGQTSATDGPWGCKERAAPTVSAIHERAEHMYLQHENVGSELWTPPPRLHTASPGSPAISRSR